jgi:hypothetical protein
MVVRLVSNFYKTRPILANSISGFIIFSFGDVVSQFIPPIASAKGNRLSWHVIKNAYTVTEISTVRAASFGLLGVLENGLLLHYWYGAMEKFIGTSMTSLRVIAGKMAVDQAVYAPGSILIYFAYTAAVAPFFGPQGQLVHGQGQGDQCSTSAADVSVPATVVQPEHSLNSAVDSFVYKAKNHLRSTWLADFLVWPATNFINFKYVPLYYRPTFMGAMLVFWQSYLSFVSNKPEEGGK